MADVFQQIYNPVGGSVLLSALVAALPPILLAILLAVLRIAPWRSAIVAAAAAFVLAWLVWGMPFTLTLAAMTHGMAFGLWPISWIVLSAVFFYNLSVESGDFDVIRRSLARATGDRRIQVVLVAFCFGALIEGIAGFGAPVAITASMLAGLGFAPIMAATLALIANTTPVAFGSLGIPITTLGGLLAPMLEHDVQATTSALSAMAGRQLALFSIIIPAYLVVLFAGWTTDGRSVAGRADRRRQLCHRPVRRVELRRTGADGVARPRCSRWRRSCCCSRSGARARSSSRTPRPALSPTMADAPSRVARAPTPPTGS